MRRRICAALTFAAASMSGCALLPHEPSVADSTAVYVWPMAACPAPTHRVLGTTLGAALIGDVVSGVVGTATSALTAAAQADKTGLSVGGTNTRFLYQGSATADADGKWTKVKLTFPNCYVVAYAKPVSQDQFVPWCRDSKFKESVPDTCGQAADGTNPVLDALLDKDKFSGSGNGLHLSLPAFYAEIALEATPYRTDAGPIARPRLYAIHYPASIISPLSDKPRHITLSLAFSSPTGTDMKANSVSIDLYAVTPGKKIAPEVTDAAQTAWTVAPTKQISDSDWPANGGRQGGYYPVTISAQLHEVGDPNAFLAAFAAAFQSSSAGTSSAITNSVTPAGIASAKQASYTNAANAQAAYSAALAGLTAYQAACLAYGDLAPAKRTPAAQATVTQSYYTMLAAANKLNAALEAAPDAGLPVLTVPKTSCMS